MNHDAGWGKPIGNYSGSMIADAVIDFLNGRKGFSHWWNTIGGDDACEHDREEIQAEILHEIAVIAQRRRNSEDLVVPTFARCRKEIGEKRWAELCAEAKTEVSGEV